MAISGAINAHNGLDLTLGGALDIIIEPYNQKLLDVPSSRGVLLMQTEI